MLVEKCVCSFTVFHLLYPFSPLYGKVNCISNTIFSVHKKNRKPKILVLFLFWFYFYFIMNLFYFYFYNEQGNRKCSQIKIAHQLSLLDDQFTVNIKTTLLSLLCFFVPRKAPVECFLKKCYFTNLVLI